MESSSACSWSRRHSITGPHFHAYYQEFVAVIGVNEVELLAGELPKKQLRLALAWGELHQQELLKDWNLLQNGELPLKIEPLI